MKTLILMIGLLFMALLTLAVAFYGMVHEVSGWGFLFFLPLICLGAAGAVWDNDKS